MTTLLTIASYTDSALNTPPVFAEVQRSCFSRFSISCPNEFLSRLYLIMENKNGRDKKLRYKLIW